MMYVHVRVHVHARVHVRVHAHAHVHVRVPYRITANQNPNKTLVSLKETFDEIDSVCFSCTKLITSTMGS
jgi:hypothetical protein